MPIRTSRSRFKGLSDDEKRQIALGSNRSRRRAERRIEASVAMCAQHQHVELQIGRSPHHGVGNLALRRHQIGFDAVAFKKGHS